MPPSDLSIGLASLSQLLKSPTTETAAAFGAQTLKTVLSPVKNEPKYLYASEVMPELKFLTKSFISHLFILLTGEFPSCEIPLSPFYVFIITAFTVFFK